MLVLIFLCGFSSYPKSKWWIIASVWDQRADQEHEIPYNSSNSQTWEHPHLSILVWVLRWFMTCVGVLTGIQGSPLLHRWYTVTSYFSPSWAPPLTRDPSKPSGHQRCRATSTRPHISCVSRSGILFAIVRVSICDALFKSESFGVTRSKGKVHWG